MNKTLNQIIEKINVELKINFELPVPTKEDKYKDRFRKIIGITEIRQMINNHVSEFDNIYTSEDRRNLKLRNNNSCIDIITKSKKSNIFSSWNHTNQLTIISIALDEEDKAYGELTLDEIDILFKTNAEELKTQTTNQNQTAHDEFEAKLDSLGITFLEFEELMNSYERLNHDVKKMFWN